MLFCFACLSLASQAFLYTIKQSTSLLGKSNLVARAQVHVVAAGARADPFFLSHSLRSQRNASQVCHLPSGPCLQALAGEGGARQAASAKKGAFGSADVSPPSSSSNSATRGFCAGTMEVRPMCANCTRPMRSLDVLGGCGG